MTLAAAMSDACAKVGIRPPRSTKPGQWVKCPVDGKAASNGAGRVLVFDDASGGIAWNWTSGQQQRFTVAGLAGAGEARAPKRDLEADRLDRERREAAIAAAQAMVRYAAQDVHPYLARKGFPEEIGLVVDAPAEFIPPGEFFDGARFQVGQMTGPFLIVPGRIGGQVVTVQMIDAEGAKLNMKAAPMGGASHRIATGRETWVCEGYATALSVRAALRLLGRSATVLSAFSAANVGKVAAGLRGSIIAADHDGPQESLHGLGAGEFYARGAGATYVMPPALGDWNDMHVAEGLRAVALHLREVRPP
jgi:putative DNA primase/helicase